MERALGRKLIAPNRTRREFLDYLGLRLPPFDPPVSVSSWKRTSTSVRAQILRSFMRGHPRGLLEKRPRVQWTETIETGKGYRIRKLRYEGYPGMWVPALLYEPTELTGRIPAVLNPNGHHAGGKAMDYKQARCINLAKRGILALNTEFIGMGELRGDADHSRIAQLDVCGVSGVGVFYLLVKRGLDVLLAHRHADVGRVAVTGLSGGGWQTAILSALDERVGVIVPVAGHSPVWQRRHCMADIGDLEQVPSDLCAIADYDTLSGMFAPRPTLFIYNRNDDCCFQTRRTRKSIYQPARKVFELLGAGDKVALHDNVDPGTHNYDRDNRCQLYRFLHCHFGLDTSEDDLPWEKELLTEAELTVELPPDNATLLSLAQGSLQSIRGQRQSRAPASGGTRMLNAARLRADRRRLASLIRLARYRDPRPSQTGRALTRRGNRIRQWVVSLDSNDNGAWNLPVTEIAPPRPSGVELVIGDSGRRSLAGPALRGVADGRRVLAADILGTGEADVGGWQFHMILAAAGERSLGLQVGQLLALARWACKRYRTTVVDVHASGQVLSVVALMAAALEPRRFRSIATNGLLDTLGRLVDFPVPYASAAPLFCFGLLREFDIADLMDLSAPTKIADTNRGPLRP
jgi:hypothetical protein